MRELNIGKKINSCRRQEGVTQEELAQYLGVSKTSVSKWETEQSYPDITFLPRLAAYFNISIDELVGYEPQMEKKDIIKLYRRFCTKFVNDPFDEVFQECQETVRKYYSCFPLLLQMGYLYANHCMLAGELEKQEKVIEEAKKLFTRVKMECADTGLAGEGRDGEALCFLIQNQPEAVLELLGTRTKPLNQDAELICQAWMMLGDMEATIRNRQGMLYQHLGGVVMQVPQLLIAEATNPIKVEMLLERTMKLEEIFQLNQLIPNPMAIIYLSAVQVYSTMGEKEKMLKYLNIYVDMVQYFFPLSVHGDEFFDKIEEWFPQTNEGYKPPRDERLVKISILEGVNKNPACKCLEEDARFHKIVWKLKQKLRLED